MGLAVSQSVRPRLRCFVRSRGKRGEFLPWKSKEPRASTLMLDSGLRSWHRGLSALSSHSFTAPPACPGCAHLPKSLDKHQYVYNGKNGNDEERCRSSLHQAPQNAHPNSRALATYLVGHFFPSPEVMSS